MPANPCNTTRWSKALRTQPTTAESGNFANKLGRRDHSSCATAGNQPAPDIRNLNLESAKESAPSPAPSGRKQAAEHKAYGEKRDVQFQVTSDITWPKPHITRLFDFKNNTKGPSSPHRFTSEFPSEWSAETTKSIKLQSPQPGLHVHPHERNTPKSHPVLTGHSQYDERYPNLLLQPDSRPISQQQLASEVKSIYAGLAMVENKCLHVDRAQAAAVQDPNTKISRDHWQAVTALHRTLLHEHHDFFLASQHPSASPALRGLADKYSMPARMWTHGIHSYLELLRRHLPDSMEYMLAFIYLAYQMMALLYETVPAFEDTWIECLGDLGRYRMAIEDEDVHDRDIWAGVARSWYTKAADKNPIIGRLYHHLAILARHNALQQMYYYSRSLTCVKLFPGARKSILTLLDPILGRTTASFTQALPIDACFIKSHGLQFLELSVNDGQISEEFLNAKAEFVTSLGNHINRVTAKWKDHGVWIAVTNIAGWFGYGAPDDPLHDAVVLEFFWKAKQSGPMARAEVQRTASSFIEPKFLRIRFGACEFYEKFPQFTERLTFKNARFLFNDTLAIALRRVGDKNVLPHVNIKLAFAVSLASNPCITNLFDDLPWTELVAFLNALLEAETHIRQQSPICEAKNIHNLLTEDLFPVDGERPDELPLPEDYLSRGLIWTYGYFPEGWFERERDEEKYYVEDASTELNRIKRVLRLGYRLAKKERWILYNSGTRKFCAISLVPVPDCRYEDSWQKRWKIFFFEALWAL